MEQFPIENNIPLPKPKKRGRKNAFVPLKAADAVRARECDIIEAAHLYFDEHIGFTTTEAERKNKYAERFRDFTSMIVADLKKSPGSFETYRKLGKFHQEKMRNSAYRRSYFNKISKRIKEELKSID